ncbi:MAG: signal recognition particle-docking protein FtsY [Candidatus Aenigmarchaeota archaeon ex4484_56]|nr:MAG: signal recognition particle-docking protein FtsY [Candidatus Aenigmarchaeota archaeon ex4484_56]
MFRLFKTAIKKLSKEKKISLEEFKFELIRANVSFEIAEEIIKSLEDKKVKNIKEFLKNELSNFLKQEKFDFIEYVKNKLENKNNILILFFGFNGSGKTTTIAKIGYLLKKHNISVIFAAGDTFRAAAIEQLSEHGSKLGIPVIKHKYGGDPAAVVYSAKKYAESKKCVILADTAGRLPSDKNLMEELKKIIRVNNPDFRILVLDSLTGNDIVEQINKFNEIGFDGIILTKLDVNERGGSVISVKQRIDKPILYTGTGQEYSDLEEYDYVRIVSKLID